MLTKSELQTFIAAAEEYPAGHGHRWFSDVGMMSLENAFNRLIERGWSKG